MLDVAYEFLKTKMDGKADTLSLLQTANRGFKQYLKSRQSASVESCGRIRSLGKESIHPSLFKYVAGDGRAEHALVEYQNLLKTFRPPKTVLESEAAQAGKGSKRGESSTFLDTAEQASVMSLKRKAHDRFIRTKRLEGEEWGRGEGGRGEEEGGEEGGEPSGKADECTALPEGGGSRPVGVAIEAPVDVPLAGPIRMHDFRDASAFIPNIPTSKHADMGYSIGSKFAGTSFADAVLDMTADDGAGMQAQRKVVSGAPNRSFLFQPAPQLCSLSPSLCLPWVCVLCNGH